MKHESKSKAWQKMFSFKKENGIHTNTGNICTSTVLPTIDSLISSNSKASSVFSWGQKMLFKTKIQLFKQKILLLGVAYTNIVTEYCKNWKNP